MEEKFVEHLGTLISRLIIIIIPCLTPNTDVFETLPLLIIKTKNPLSKLKE